ncbi:unnamed protein product [Blepharisma stoltei]|uniref:Uncharacterized protein n=1 Tax=Blepharisma stoltei TaxID=1481888 RepID=A0AAU9IBK6_9CILI|nr:unnamed protein product [Blepharisma stoltei]
MNVNFHNKPSVTLHGSTWDAKHLDKFLSSQWGEKLFSSKRNSAMSLPPSQPNPALAPFLNGDTNIRPSPAFISLPRTSEAPAFLTKETKPMTMMSWRNDQRPFEPSQPDMIKIGEKMSQLEKRRLEDDTEYNKRILPSKRRQLYEAAKYREKEYKKLKNERLAIIKKERIISNAYPNGILGVDSPDRPDLSSHYWKMQKQDMIKEQEDRLKREARAINMLKYRGTSPGIGFSHSNIENPPVEKPRGLKRVEDEVPEQYHNTHNSLFVPTVDRISEDRNERLKSLWRGNRDYNIISGAYFKD